MARGGNQEVNAGIRAKSPRLTSDLRLAQRQFKRFGSTAKRDLAKSFGGIRRDIIGALGVGIGVGALAKAGRDVFDFQTALTRLQIQARKSPAEIGAFRKELEQTAVTTGASRDDLLALVRQYVSATGDFDTARASIELFGKALVATGADAGDLAKVTAALQQTFSVDPSQFEAALSILARTGKLGSVEFAQMASLLGPLAAGFSRFGKVGVDNLADLSAAFQSIQAGFGFSPEQAATGLEGLFTALAKNAGRFEKAGVKIFNVAKDGTKSFRPFGDIIDDISASKLIKDPTKLIKALGRAEAARAYEELRKNRSGWVKIREAATGAKDIIDDALTFMGSSSGRVARSFEGMKATIAEVFTPERIEKFADAMESVADAVKLIADNLVLATAAYVAFKNAALIGAGVKAAASGLTAAAAGAGTGAAAAGAAIGVGSALAVGAAGAGGYLAGRQLDEWLGLSDKIAGVANGTDELRGRERIADILSASRRVGTGGGRFSKQVLRRAREEGFLSDQNNINRGRIAELGGGRNVQALVEAIVGAARAQQLTVTVGLDKELVLHGQSQQTRRGAQ